MLKWDGICRPQHPHNRQGALHIYSADYPCGLSLIAANSLAGRRSNDIVRLSTRELPDQQLPDRLATTIL